MLVIVKIVVKEGEIRGNCVKLIMVIIMFNIMYFLSFL